MAKGLKLTAEGEQLVDLPAAEAAELDQTRAVIAAMNARQAQAGATMRSLAPSAALRTKLRDGAALSAPETAQVLRWLALTIDPTILTEGSP